MILTNSSTPTFAISFVFHTRLAVQVIFIKNVGNIVYPPLLTLHQAPGDPLPQNERKIASLNYEDILTAIVSKTGNLVIQVQHGFSLKIG